MAGPTGAVKVMVATKPVDLPSEAGQDCHRDRQHPFRTTPERDAHRQASSSGPKAQKFPDQGNTEGPAYDAATSKAAERNALLGTTRLYALHRPITAPSASDRAVDRHRLQARSGKAVKRS